MKTLRSFLALIALSFAALTVVRADPAALSQTAFYTDNTTDVEELEASYGIWGYQNDEIYSFVLSYDFATGLDLDGVLLSVWYYDEGTEYESSAWVEGPGRDGGMGLSWLDGFVEIPSNLTGTITVTVGFSFSDGSVLYETLTHELD